MQTGAAQLAVAEPLLLQLLDLYQQQQELPVEPLRHPKLLQLLLSGVCAAFCNVFQRTDLFESAFAHAGRLCHRHVVHFFVSSI